MFTFATNYSERMAHVNPPQTRRERIFGETQDELAAAARALLVDGGPEAVTIRAVAGRAGMTGDIKFFIILLGLITVRVESILFTSEHSISHR